jgi:DNA-binding response OmpR family regulator
MLRSRRKQMAEARKKILCIEDDRETAKLIANELTERGFYALIAYDAQVGVAAIIKRVPDLVLCDVGLPSMSGFEILETVNGVTPRSNRIPFVFLTGWVDRDDELHGRSLGADDYLTKPIDFDILEQIIRARLARGVVRHEMALKAPVPASRITQRRLPKKGIHEQAVELTDAPTVDLYTHQTEPVAEGSKSEEPLKLAPLKSFDKS